ncbi:MULTISPECIES: adenosine-specific kinase [Moorena]|uniref:adenosine-specific kinase n=1 Tax=Moorena sp. SIO1G6 TaxID=2607840 RepID=UPI001E443A8D|nr:MULTISPECIES: adenosine-specific kinase [Moorena]
MKTVLDLYQVMVGTSTQLKFAITFCEASGSYLIRATGNDPTLKSNPTHNPQGIEQSSPCAIELCSRCGSASGHSFLIVLKEAYPINLLNPIQQCPEVCPIHSSTPPIR